MGQRATQRGLLGWARRPKRRKMMIDSQVAAVGGIALDEGAVQALKASHRGDVLRPGDDGYDTARAIHNGMIDRRPALIARCAGVADVISAVRFAREHELLVSVRGGG